MLHLKPRSFNFSNCRLSTYSTKKINFGINPAPPRLPSKEQEEYERLQKLSTGSFSTPKAITNTDSIAHMGPKLHVNQPVSAPSVEEKKLEPRVAVKINGEELHPDVRRGAKPEFEGDRNPVTGEIGGPKSEPLRWGSTGERGDWSYNGRVTDF